MSDTPSPDELERLFEQHGIPRRHLYPLRYRVVRRLGLGIRPPIRYRLIEHFLYEGLVAAVLLIAAAHLLYLFDGTNTRWAWPTALVLLVSIPVINWQRYRGIRRRIGLAP